MSDLFISMEYNDRQFEGITEFRNELEKTYQFQLRHKWIPAYAEGAESWITIFVNSEFAKFLTAAVTGGIAWDLIKVGSKRYVFTPFLNAIEKLNTENKRWNGLKIVRLKFQFDDCEVLIGGLNKNFTSILSNVFNEISKKKPKFEYEVGQDVVKIELPIRIIQNEFKVDRYIMQTANTDYSTEAYLKLWKLTFSTGFPIMIYDFKNDTLKDIL